MASAIDVTKPISGTTPGPTTQSVRDNFSIASSEITNLQNVTVGGPFLSLRGGTVSGVAPGTITINRGTILPPLPTGFGAVPVWVIGNTAENPAVFADAFANSGGFLLRRANGTAAVPQPLNTGEMIGDIGWRGYGTSGYGTAMVRIAGHAYEPANLAWSDGAQGSRLVFSTSLPGTAVLTPQMTVGPGVTIGPATGPQPTPPMTTGDLNVTGRLLVNGSAISGGPGGGITSIVFSAPLTGGTITTSGTVGLGNVPVSNLAGGAGASASTFWCGDGTWKAAGGSGTPGNPTAFVSAAAVNGVATTFMRSDAAPALAVVNSTVGTYTNATVTVDAQGRITTAANGTGSSGTPGGVAGNVQYNSAGTSFGGSTGATFSASSLTALNIALGGDVPGDMYFRNASGNLTRIPPGAAGNFLQSTGATAPIWVLLSPGTGTVSNGTQGQLAIYPNAGSNAIVAGVTMSGDATINATGALTLANIVGLTAGNYTSTNLTVDSKGRITAASNGTGGSGLPLTGGTITGTAPGNVIVQRAGTLPTAAAGAVATFWGVGNTGENAAVVVDAIANVPGVILRRADVTGTGPIQNGEVIGNIGFRGYGASGYAAVGNARVLVTALETFDDAHQGTKLEISTTPPLSATAVVQATFDRGLTVGVGTPQQATPAPGDLNCMRLLVNGLAPGAVTETYAAINAAGTTLGAATALGNDFCEVTGQTASGTGVILPAATACLKRKVRNSLVGVSILIYPPSGVTINTQAASAPITLLPNSIAYFEASATKWFTIP